MRSPATLAACAPTTTWRASSGARRHVDPKLIRAFVRRLQLLQSFEPGYRLETDYIQDAAGMVGNAVPPALAAALVTPFAEQLR